MNVRDLLRKLQNTTSPLARDPSLGPREVQNRRLDALERQWQAKLDEDRERQLRELLLQRQRQESTKSLNDGISPLKYNGVGYKIKKPPKEQAFYNRGRLL